MVIAGKGHETTQEVDGEFVAVRRSRGRARGARPAERDLMRPRTLGEVAAAVGGAVREGADTTIGGVATDSRAVRPDSLFVALVGERLDGHDFIADALERGAAAVMVRGVRRRGARRARP